MAKGEEWKHEMFLWLLFGATKIEAIALRHVDIILINPLHLHLFSGPTHNTFSL